MPYNNYQHQFERLSSHISYGRIKSYDYRLDKALYGEYDNAPPTVHPIDKVDAEESHSNISYYAKIFGQKFLSICTIGFSILFRLICIGFTVSLIVIGSLYVHDCSCQPFIPIYLIVSGCLLCLLIFYAVYRSCTISDVENSDLSETSRNIFRYITDFLYLFVFAWFITGSVKVYTIHGDVNFDNTNSKCYCHALVYKFTFWSITSFYIIFASFLVMGLLTMFVKYLYSCFRN